MTLRKVGDLALSVNHPVGSQTTPPKNKLAPSSVAKEKTEPQTEIPLEFHPLANLFPMLDDTDYVNLRNDIKTNGLNVPIVRYEGKVLDGRNRSRVCKELGIESDVVEYVGDDPLGFVLSMNLHRRHLDASQRAMIAADLANMKRGTRTDLELPANLPEVSQAIAAETMKVSERLLRDAKRVKEEGSNEQIESIRNGSKSVTKVLQEIKAKETEPVKPKAATKKRQINSAVKQVTDDARPEPLYDSANNRTNKKAVPLKDASWKDVQNLPAGEQIQWFDVVIRQQRKTYIPDDRRRLNSVLYGIIDDMD